MRELKNKNKALFNHMIEKQNELCRLKNRNAALDSKATTLDDKLLLKNIVGERDTARKA